MYIHPLDKYLKTILIFVHKNKNINKIRKQTDNSKTFIKKKKHARSHGQYL